MCMGIFACKISAGEVEARKLGLTSKSNLDSNPGATGPTTYEATESAACSTANTAADPTTNTTTNSTACFRSNLQRRRMPPQG